MKRTFEVSPWHVKTTKWAPEDKLLQESITALANENLGMRGFFEEGYSDTTLQGVYLGGVWFPDKTRVGWWKNGYPKYFGKMINAVNFMKLTIAVNGEQVDFAKQTPTDFNLDLDMRRGTLTRTVTATVGGAPVTLKFERFVSAVQKELVGQRLTVQSPAEIDLAISAQIDADVYNQDANYDEQFWQVLDRKASGKGALLVSQTKANDFGTPQFTVAMQTSVKTDLPHVGDAVEAKQVANHFAGHVAAGQSVTLEKRTIVTTSRDYADQAELVAAAQDLV
ncbi:glycoside hydrolase family 65 protein, partial [Limosilactobacillus fermentum]|nr:glycoside hydrolase family 65 protein [Limosilactobacillus fermentum]